MACNLTWALDLAIYIRYTHIYIGPRYVSWPRATLSHPAIAHPSIRSLSSRQLISRPPTHDRVLDLTYCAELTPSDFAAAAITLRHTSMFAGLRLLDTPLGEAVTALCECARMSTSLQVPTPLPARLPPDPSPSSNPTFLFLTFLPS